MGTQSKGRRVDATVLYPSMEIKQSDFRRVTRAVVAEEPAAAPEAAETPKAKEA